MKRLIPGVVIMLALVGFTLFSLGATEEPDNPTYWVELDNAFGLIEGADLKVDGVRAGKLTKLVLDRETYHAKVQFEVTQKGFGQLRSNATCETRPQSLIGEYFVDCKPGKAPKKLPVGGTIPIERTGTNVPVDLINNVMRRPFRERFTIIFNELGAGLSARGDDLNETIRRANPALRETDRVLAILASQRDTIARLYGDADAVLKRLADNRGDVGRFVEEARDTAAVQASRADELRAQFRVFPTFLRELRPTMERLGTAADEQRPLLQNLFENSGRLDRFLEELGPFSEASRPAIRSLSEAAREGRPAVRAGIPVIRQLREVARPAPEVGTNLSLTLNDLDDRSRAVEKDPRSPGGEGYTGFEAILRYVFNQSQSINLFDGNSYILKVAAFLDNNCAQYADAAQARAASREKCRAWLGPNQIGVNQPDPTAGGARAASAEARERRGDDEEEADEPRSAAAEPDRPSPSRESRGSSAPAPARQGVAIPKAVQDAIDKLPPAVRDVVQQTLPQKLPDLPPAVTQASPQVSQAQVLDYLLGP